jgi:hypothetical protein
MQVNNLSMTDNGYKKNALGRNWQKDFDPGTVSFDVVWSGPITRQVSVPNGTLGNNYAGDYVENQVTVTWSGTNQTTGFSFTANPGTFATSSFDGGFAELGQEQNGSFFSSGDAPAQPDGASAAASLGQGLAALAGPGGTAALHPAAVDSALSDSGLALGGSSAGTGAWQPLPTGGLNAGAAAAAADGGTTVHPAAQDTQAADPFADPMALFTEVGW